MMGSQRPTKSTRPTEVLLIVAVIGVTIALMLGASDVHRLGAGLAIIAVPLVILYVIIRFAVAHGVRQAKREQDLYR